MRRFASIGPPRVRFEVVAKADGLRVLSHPEPRLAAAYAGAVVEAAHRVEAALGREVVANRVASVSLTPPAIVLRSWSAARASLDAVRRTWPADLRIVRTDVASCYPSIRPPVVADALEGVGVAAPAVAACVRVLEEFGDAGVPGLPIGPAPSAVLSNAVLATGDRALRRTGLAFARWVDDWWIAAGSASQLAAALGLLGDALATAGLRLNDAKTRVVDRNDVGWASTAEYHRAAHAHAVPVVPGPYALVPGHGRVGPGRRTSRPANGQR